MAEFHLDSSHLENAVLGMGTRRDPSEYTFARRTSLYPKEVLDTYYRNSWACRRVVEIMPRFMCRKWGNPTLSGENNDAKLIEDLQTKYSLLKVRKKFKQAQIWANLYGRCYILITTEDDSVSEIKPGDAISDLIVLDKHKLYPDPVLSNYSRLNPEYYVLASHDTIQANIIIVNSSQWLNKIHKSRVLLFTGNDLPDDEKIRNNACEASVLEPFIEVWKRFFTGYASLSNIINDFDIFIHYIDGIFEKLWQGGKDAERQLRDRLEVVHASKSVYGGMVGDLKSEKFEYASRSLAGVGDIADRLQSELIAASGLPKSVLFGEFAAGLDASGKITGEQRYLNELVEESQTDKFSDNIQELNLLLAPTKKAFGWQWQPLYTETAQGIAEIRKIYAETDQINIGTGIYSAEEGRSRYEGKDFSSEVVLSRQDEVGVRLSDLERVKGRVRYRGKLYIPNRPYYTGDQLLVLATKNGFVQVIKFSEKDVDVNAIAENPHTPTYWANLFYSFGEPKFDDATPTKKVIQWQGFEIGLQYLPFETRHGKMLLAGYGHFRKTKGADGMAVDVYVATKLESPKLFVVEQYINGEFDEEKFIIGVDTIEEARAIYLLAMPEEFLGSIREENLNYLNSLRRDADTFIVSGEVLGEDEFDAIAAVDDEDVAEAIANWKEIAPGTYANILNADT